MGWFFGDDESPKGNEGTVVATQTVNIADSHPAIKIIGEYDKLTIFLLMWIVLLLFFQFLVIIYKEWRKAMKKKYLHRSNSIDLKL